MHFLVWIINCTRCTVHTLKLYDKLYPYYAGSLRWIFCIFSYVSRCSTSLFYRAFHIEHSGYFIGLINENFLHFFRRLMVNILDTLSGVSRTSISILSSVSRLIIEIFCPTTHSQLSRYFVRRFTANSPPVVSRCWVFLVLGPAPLFFFGFS